MEKLKKERTINDESSKSSDRMIDELKSENDSLRDKLTSLEQEKVNLISEKERRERDCKSMQIELNRINSMIHNYKNLAGGSDFSYS